jgi:peptide/nickel transport system permease protein
MLRFFAKRLGWALLTLFLVLSFVFFLARLTGDPVRLMLPQQATQEDVERVRDALGLNRPLEAQYLSFVGGVLQGDFGDSIRQNRPALDMIIERLPATLELAVISFVVGFTLALALAVLGEISGSRRLRNFMLWVATARQAIPPYLFGILLVLIFAVHFGLVPALGRSDWTSYLLPVATISTFEIALYLRLINSSFDQMRSSDWVRTARAKGVSRARIVFRHMLPNALLPVVTIAGINLGVLIGGLVVLEMVFNWPGMGRLIVQGVTTRDYPLVQAGVLVIAFIFVLINLFVDLLYAVLDPRVRLA